MKSVNIRKTIRNLINMNETLNYNLLFELEDYPDYFINIEGDIWSQKKRNMIKLKPCQHKGYKRVCFYNNGINKSVLVHRLLAQTFIPNPNNLTQVDHINKNRNDNRLENLRWVNHTDNTRNSGLRRDNTSKIQGVHRVDLKGYSCWIAQWNDNNSKRCSKTFGFNTCGGGEKAKQLAIEFRQKMVDELYNRPK